MLLANIIDLLEITSSHSGLLRGIKFLEDTAATTETRSPPSVGRGMPSYPQWICCEMHARKNVSIDKDTVSCQSSSRPGSPTKIRLLIGKSDWLPLGEYKATSCTTKLVVSAVFPPLLIL